MNFYLNVECVNYSQIRSQLLTIEKKQLIHQQTVSRETLYQPNTTYSYFADKIMKAIASYILGEKCDYLTSQLITF